MKKTNKTLKRKNQTSRVIRERDLIPWKYCLLTLVCGSFLVAGFFGAARQHFASIDYGIKNSTLRKDIKELEAEQKRLILAREVAFSPTEIKKAAKKFGFVENSHNFSETFSAIKISDKKIESDKKESSEDKKENSDKKSKPEDKKTLVKTDKKEEKATSDKNSKDKEPKKTKAKDSEADKKVIARERKVSTK